MFPIILVAVVNGLSHTFLTPSITNPCDKIECGPLQCPGGFTQQSVPGHCCPYCVNPDIKIEKVYNGPTGEAGGQPSPIPTCKDVWCFPTLCTGTETAPTTTNGQCCPRCDWLIDWLIDRTNTHTHITLILLLLPLLLPHTHITLIRTCKRKYIWSVFFEKILCPVFLRRRRERRLCVIDVQVMNNSTCTPVTRTCISFAYFTKNPCIFTY